MHTRSLLPAFCVRLRRVLVGLALLSGVLPLAKAGVYLSSYNFAANNLPYVWTDESLPTPYRLRVKFSGNHHAVNGWNNNYQTLESVPGTGSYTVELYWLKYASDQTTLLETGTFHTYSVYIQPASNPPDWTSTSGSTSATVNQSITYTFTAHDPNGDLNQMEVAWCTPSGAVSAIHPWFSIGSNQTQYSTTRTITFNQGAGTYQLWVNAKDAQGNVRDPWAHNISGERISINVTNGQSPPVITSSSSASGTVGSAFSYQITATNSPTSFGASNLPPGLSVNASTGAISGTPTSAGTYNAIISATHSGGTGSGSLSITINSSGGGGQQTTTFTSNGTFTVPSGVTSVAVLVVGGGGGGGWHGNDGGGGGGGGGGVVYSSAYGVSPGQQISVTVGAGGSAGYGVSGWPANGGNSSFGSITADGGGGGGNWNHDSGWSGGSGGGGTDYANSPGGSGTAGQGNQGGSGSRSTYYAAGGGGGASGAGGSGNGGSGNGGNGGSGYTHNGVVYGSGGGGGTNANVGAASGGSGAGNGGTPSLAATSAVNGRGGGGGGSGNNNGNGGNGGSGVVIVTFILSTGPAPVTALSASSGSNSVTGDTNSTTPPVLTVNLGQPFTITSITADGNGDLVSQQFDLSVNGGAWSLGNSSNNRLWTGGPTGTHTLAKTFSSGDLGIGTYRFRARGRDEQDQFSTYQYVDVVVTAIPVTTVTASSGPSIVTGSANASSPPVLSVNLEQTFTLTSVTSDGSNDLVAQQFDLSANGGAWSLGNSVNNRLWEGGPTGSNTLAKTFNAWEFGLGTYRFRAQGRDAQNQVSQYQYVDVVISIGGGGSGPGSGGTVAQNGSTYTHTFTSSGTFTVPSGGLAGVNVLIVGGGGGGGGGPGNNGGGGGGGGGVVSLVNQTLVGGAYAISVGAGGAGGAPGTGANGGESSAFGSVGQGGGGGGGYQASGQAGASGGGSGRDAGSGSGGGGSQGGSGGSAPGISWSSAGGGGGAGGSGQNGGEDYQSRSGSPSMGGPGLPFDITGTTTYYGGGGGGAWETGGGSAPSGGNGGGGAGSNGGGAGSNGINGLGGGGGGGQNGPAGNGGSGVVIIQYTVTPPYGFEITQVGGWPAVAGCGDSVAPTVRVRNVGSNSWGPSHFLSIFRPDGTVPDYGIRSVDGVPPGGEIDVSFPAFDLEPDAGTYTYPVRLEHQGIGYYGTVGLSITIEVRDRPRKPPMGGDAYVTTAGFKMRWRKAAGASGYRVDVATTWNFAPGSFALTNVDVGNVTEYTVTGLSPGTEYFYRVRGVNSFGVSDNSDSGRTETYATNDVWLQLAKTGAGVFDMRFGAGGAIADVLLTPTNERMTMGHGNDTDGRFGWVLWAGSDGLDLKPEHQNPDYNSRFNVDQFGGYYNPIAGEPARLTGINSVTRNGNVVEVYSVPRKQWHQPLDLYMSATFPTYSRYEKVAENVVKVRRVVLFGPVTYYGTTYNTYPTGMYWESNWTTFDAASDRPNAFNAYGGDKTSFAFTNNGQLPSDSYHRPSSGNNNYRAVPVGNTQGFYAAFRDNGGGYGPALAIVFGKRDVVIRAAQATQTGRHVLNALNWNVGFALLPALELNPSVQAGDVIDYTFYLIGDNAMNQAYLDQLTTYANVLSDTNPALPPAQAFYGASYFTDPQYANYPGRNELKVIVDQLAANLNAAGTETVHLGNLLGSP